jgi:hypothetical protein
MALGLFPQFVEEFFRFLDIEVFVKFAVYLNAGSCSAGSQTLELNRGKQSIRCDFAQTYAQLTFDASDNVVGSLKQTGQVGANQDVIFPDRLAPQERVEGHDGIDFGRIQVEIFADVLDRFRFHVAMFLLSQQQHGNQCGSLLGIDGDQVFEFFLCFWRKHLSSDYLSHSRAPFFHT